MKLSYSRLIWMVLLGTVLGTLPVLGANPCVILPDGRKVEGTEIRTSREGAIYLVTPAGRLEYPKGTKVMMDEPLELKKAAELLKARKYDEAIPVLEKVAEGYRYLEWDQKARKLLAAAYNGKQDWKKASEGFDSVMADFPASRDDGDVRFGYLQALSGAGDTNKIMPLLKTAIAKGPRAEAALAQMIRARASLAAGDVEGALYDFMRTARFFQEYKELAAEAAFQTAECLGKLGDAERAGAYYRQVAVLYPDSPFVDQAKVKAGTTP